MITLPSNISDNNRKTGNRPSVLVSIDGSEKYYSTSSYTGYENRIKRSQSINMSVDPFGGMATVSGTNIEVLKAGESVNFGTPVEITPRAQGPLAGGGRLYGYDLSDYEIARSTGTASNISDVDISVGQRYTAVGYYIYRGYLQFNIPSGMTSCEQAFIRLSGLADASATDFDIYVVEGEWNAAAGTLGEGSYDEFDGWQSGLTTYDGTRLNETWSSSYFSTTTDNMIRLNRTGRDLVTSNTGGVLKLMLLSSRDYAATTPTGDEYIRFGTPSETTLELIYNTVKPDNRRARIYLGYRDTSNALPASTSSMLNVWSGVVDRYNIKESILNLILRHDDFKRNVLLSQNVMTVEDYEFLPENNIGKTIPFVYGDFTTAVKHLNPIASSLNEDDTDNRYGNGDFIKALIYKQTDTDIRGKAANHTITDIGFFGAIYEDALASYAPITADISDLTDGEVRLSEGTATSFPYELSSDATGSTSIGPFVSLTATRSTNFGSTDPNNAIDSDATNWTTLNGDGQIVEYYWYQPYGVSSLYDAAKFTMEVYAENGYATDKIQVTVNARQDDGTPIDYQQYINADGQIYQDIPLLYAPQSIVKIIVTIRSITGFTSPFKFRNVAISRGYSRKINDYFFIRGKGHLDDGSGTFTGTPSKLIENPADIVHGLCVNEGDLTTSSDIDTTSFASSRTILDSWTNAFQWDGDIIATKNLFNYNGSKGIIDEIAKQCNSDVFWDYTGKLKIKTFTDTASFPNSGTDIPDNEDIYTTSETVTSGELNENPIMSNSFTLEQIDIDNVYNNFIMNYGIENGSGNYRKLLHIGNGEGVAATVVTNTNMTESYLERSQTIANLAYYTSNSYTEIQKTNTLQFNAWAVQDEETANKLLQRMVEWYTRRRYVATFTTKMSAVALELGDFINIRHDDIQDQFGEGEMNIKKWKVIDINIDLTNFRIGITAIEAGVY